MPGATPATAKDRRSSVAADPSRDAGAGRGKAWPAAAGVRAAAPRARGRNSVARWPRRRPRASTPIDDRCRSTCDAGVARRADARARGRTAPRWTRRPGADRPAAVAHAERVHDLARPARPAASPAMRRERHGDRACRATGRAPRPPADPHGGHVAASPLPRRRDRAGGRDRLVAGARARRRPRRAAAARAVTHVEVRRCAPAAPRAPSPRASISTTRGLVGGGQPVVGRLEKTDQSLDSSSSVERHRVSFTSSIWAARSAAASPKGAGRCCRSAAPGRAASPHGARVRTGVSCSICIASPIRLCGLVLARAVAVSR